LWEVRTVLRDRQLALGELLKAIREFRKFTDQPVTLRGGDYAHAVQELNRRLIGQTGYCNLDRCVDGAPGERRSQRLSDSRSISTPVAFISIFFNSKSHLSISRLKPFWAAMALALQIGQKYSPRNRKSESSIVML
jgi:hypothetical protein